MKSKIIVLTVLMLLGMSVGRIHAQIPTIDLAAIGNLIKSLATSGKELATSGAQLEILKRNYQQAKEAIDKLEKISEVIRRSQRLAETFKIYKNLLMYQSQHLEDVFRNPYMYKYEKQQILSMFKDINTQVQMILEDLKPIITSKSGVKMSDAERINLINASNQSVKELYGSQSAELEILKIKAKQRKMEAFRKKQRDNLLFY